MPRRFIRRENWEFGGAAPGSEETKEPEVAQAPARLDARLHHDLLRGRVTRCSCGRPAQASRRERQPGTRCRLDNHHRGAPLRRRPRTPRRPQPPRRTSPRPRTQRHLPMRPQRRPTRPQPRPTPQTLRRRTMRCHRSMPRVPRVLQPRLSRRPSRTRTHRSRPERRRVPGRRPSCARCSCRS